MATSKSDFRRAYEAVRSCVARYSDTGIDGLDVARMYSSRDDQFVVMAISCYAARLKIDPLVERFYERKDWFSV